MSTNSSLISSGITVEELSQKYQKLLQEYNRIRAQHSVLRKAIVNEQSNNVDLTNELKNKENDLRKYSLEIDNLIFHNRGLNKKIEALQEEGPKKKSSSWLPNNQLKKEMQEVKVALDAAVLDLENKIHENVIKYIESLYLELDEIKSNHQIAIDELKSQNQALQLKISQILNEYELKIKDFEDGVSTLKREKSVVETEMRKVLETMKNLSETPIQFNSSITVDDVFLSSDMLEFLQNLKDNEKIQSLEGEDYNLLFNFARKFIKDLTSRFNWNDFTNGLNLLLKDLRLFMDLQENQLTYINEHWKPTNLAETIVKIKDLQRSFDQSFHKILPSLASIFNQSKPYSWVAHSDEFLMEQNFQNVVSQIFPVLSLVSELLNICTSSDKCQDFLPSSSEYKDAINQYSETSSKVHKLCSQFLSWKDHPVAQLFTDEKSALTKWSRDFKINTALLFNHHAQKLQAQNISIEDHWFIKACNVQMLGILSNLKTSFDRVFSMCVIWLETFTNIDLQTIEFILKISAQTRSKTDSIDQDRGSNFSVDSIPSTSFIPYTATLNLLTSNMAFKEEKEQLLQTLQAEIDVNQSQAQTIDNLKKEITNYEHSLQEESNNSKQLKQMIDDISQKLLTKESELAESLAQNLEKEEMINQLNILREEEEKRLTNGNHDLNYIDHNNHEDDIDDNQPLNLVSMKINGTKDSNQLNGSNRSQSPISVESAHSNSPISNLFRQNHDIQIRNLLEKLEISQAETFRLHQVLLGNSQLLRDSELEKQKLRDQVAELTEQLSKSKETLSTIESQYQAQTQNLTTPEEGNTHDSLV